MARQVLVQVTCDVCEAPDAAAFTFAVERSAFEIDLCSEHRGQFTNALAPFVSRARTARRAASDGASTSSAKKPGRRTSSQTESIRAWAKEQGFTISDRGRIPGHIETAYNERAGAES